MVPFSCALSLRDMLDDAGMFHLFHEYVGMSHTSSEEEESDLVHFLQNLFSTPGSVSNLQECAAT